MGLNAATRLGLAYLLRHWFLILIAALIISPVGPHLLVWYSYTNYGTYKGMNECIYLGGGGFVEINDGDICPVIVIMDRRDKQ
ncbi:hypothetical protein [Nitrosomonas sp.]|uniref:hypothetical protein n=1 Tax=Nitrosomonas sp. TaxID=42353 RepID=UPI001D83E2A2|nr:hypothetical protein [Nitrosomonas sp.]MCB1950006.1 hypothetical protein [Nitrosomonas sp.]